MHNINENRMFCVGSAWHNAGVRVNKALTAKEAIETASLNYQVKLQELYYKTDEQYNIVEGRKGVIREDNNKIIGTVGDRYTVVQNIAAFDFFDAVVEQGAAMYESAGALGQGERIWILAKLPGHIIVFKDDVVDKYLVLTNSHDGTSALRMYYTPIRVVCQNTLNASLKNAKDGISIRHCGNINTKMSEAKRVLGLALDFYAGFEAMSQQMAVIKLSDDQISKYYDRVLKIDEKEEKTTRSENIKSDLLHLQCRGQGNDVDGIRNTLWTSYNAVTEYADHCRTVKGGENNRLESCIFGSGAVLKERALTLAMELIPA